MAMDAVVAAGVVILLVLVVMVLLHVPGARRAAFRFVNRVFVWLLRAGVPFGSWVPAGRMMLLTVAGRKTGVARTTPVELLEMDGRRWVIQTHGSREGASSWVLNLRAAGEATVARGRRSERFGAVELSEQEAAAVLEMLLAPAASSRIRRALLRHALPSGPAGEAEHFAAMGRLHRVFELTPLPVAAEAGDARRSAA
ncbi:MAG TPA: nitroreductase family deazaflavin-dependent oxidoreductase [Actinocrinis sp.]|jgi:deazaflavin-dependent oxidoreductase (nitroreductase family)